MNENHTSIMITDVPTLLSGINVPDYVVEVPVTGDWASYRHSPSPFTASKKEGR